MTSQPNHSLPFDPDGPPLEEQAGKRALAELARRELMKKDFLVHCQEFSPGYKVGWVHEDLALRLTRFFNQLQRGERPRLMILFPPRHGKSLTASILASSWFLGLDPTLKIMNIGYNLDLPLEFSKEVREILRKPLYQDVYEKTKLRIDDRSAEKWRTTKGGGYMAAGLQGGITGKGANVIMVDDPLKGQDEADNPIHREKVWMTYSAVVRTRLAPGGGIIIIQTHWNDDDLAGRLKKVNEDIEEGKKGSEFLIPFDIVKYPALAEQYEYRDEETLDIIRTDEPIEEDELDEMNYTFLRAPNEPLHKERYNYDELMELKSTLPERVWSALYQQNPVPESGLHFTHDMFHFISSPPRLGGTKVVTAWDLAIGTQKSNNYTAGATVQYHHGGSMFCRRIQRFKKNMHGIIAAIIEEAEYHFFHEDQHQYKVVIEGGQIWKTLESTFKERWKKAGLPFSMFEIVTPTTDKELRAKPLLTRMEEGTYYFITGAEWFTDAKHEMIRFPGGSDHDQIDAQAWAVRALSEMGKPKNVDHQLPAVNDHGTIVARNRYRNRTVNEMIREHVNKEHSNKADGSWRAA